MKQIHYGNTGAILGFYDDEIHENIPYPRISVDEDVWQDCVSNQIFRRVHNEQIVEYTPPPPPLDEIKSVARERLKQQAQARITGGIVSSALGGEHKYQTALTDQANLQARLFSALNADSDNTWSIWCIDADNNAERKPHTATQLQHLALDFGRHIEESQAAHEMALKRLNQAETADEIEGIFIK